MVKKNGDLSGLDASQTGGRFALLWFLLSSLGWIAGIISGGAAGAALGILAGEAAGRLVGWIAGEPASTAAAVALGLAVGWLVGGFVCGAVVGVCQRLALGDRIANAKRWVAASAVGGGLSGVSCGVLVGFSMLFAAGETFLGSSTGVIRSFGMIISLLVCGLLFLSFSAPAIGMAQWLLLNRQFPRSRSVYWLAAPLIVRPIEITMILLGVIAFWFLSPNGSFFASLALALSALLGLCLTPLVTSGVMDWMLRNPGNT
jgi:hypothetical protein